jgi:hypothetical protein
MSAEIYSFENLWRQYRNCRRNKRNTINALAFEIAAEAQLLTLQQELRAHTYRPGPSICLVTEGPKPRGSIRYYGKSGMPRLIRVDYHGAKEVPAGTCNAILKAAGLKGKQ